MFDFCFLAKERATELLANSWTELMDRLCNQYSLWEFPTPAIPKESSVQSKTVPKKWFDATLSVWNGGGINIIWLHFEVQQYERMGLVAETQETHALHLRLA